MASSETDDAPVKGEVAEPEAAALETGKPEAEPAALDGIDFGDDSEAEAAPDAPAEQVPAETVTTPDGVEIMAFDAWFQLIWCGGFHMASALTSLDGLAPLEGDAEEIERKGARAVYDTAAESPMFRFIVKPGGKWIERGMAVFALASVKAQLVRAELAVRRAERAEAEAAAKAAETDNGADDHVAQPVAGDPGDVSGDARAFATGDDMGLAA